MSVTEATAKTIFLQALELATLAEREEYLQTQCGSDLDLRREVEELLRHHGGVGAFLESPPTAVVESAEQLHNIAPQTLSLGFLSPPSRADSLGRLAHYEVLEVVGSGGMGVVLKAFDEQLQRTVAIKAMAPQLAASAGCRQRFIREAQAAAAVNHDNVVDIYAVEGAGPVPYLVMEYVGGISLEDKLKQQGPLALKEILRIGLQTADGLAAAHRQGLVHRDVKPANILLENGVERVKITDFGLARAADDVSVTQTGVIAGTPAYMSPEQARGDAVDHRSDLFSLGSVLYALSTGRSAFRGSTSLGVLKRVCEETPHPIRDLNPDIPEWLCALIEKLHAKDPAERFQSAAELAETLGGYLAHVQQPSLPLPTAIFPAAAPEKPRAPNTARGSRRAGRRWAIAAVAALVLLGLTLSLTDASGLTHVAAMVIRIFTPDGVLVVETDDPAVKVTIEGDGGLIITGAGPQEVRLRPGNYKVLALKDGRRVPLEREIVSIGKGGKEIVKVKLEGLPVPTAATIEPGAFVLLGGNDVTERQFDTLAEAVQIANDGDTIEIRGNGPFLSPPIRIQGTALRIRAGAGFRPVIKLSPQWHQHEGHCFVTNSLLVLEGLEVHRAPWEIQRSVAKSKAVVHPTGSTGALWAANCRFIGPIAGHDCAVCILRNCEVFADQAGISGRYHPGARFRIENCLFRTNGSAMGPNNVAAFHDTLIQVHRSTFVGNNFVWLLLRSPPATSSNGPQASKPIRLEVEASVLEVRSLLGFTQTSDFLELADLLEPVPAEATLLELLEWRGERNVYADGSALVQWSADLKFSPPPHGPQDLQAWKEFWGCPETGSREGSIRFQGGNLPSLSDAAVEQLTPEDFRLRPDSAGYRAFPDGKDLGADVELVGPGPAYERWKQTPEYQDWLKETGQLRTEAPQPETRAFVVLGGAGSAERTFDTLADAVQHASDGDTIEIRGNGPYVSDGVTIGMPLIIRAGEGYAPSIALSQASADKNIPLLATSHALVLEGLDLRRMGGGGKVANRLPRLLGLWESGALHVANCRLIVKADPRQLSLGALFGSKAKSVSVRNSVLTSNTAGELGWDLTSGGRGHIENCVSASVGLGFGLREGDVTDVSVRVRGNTFVGRCASLTLWSQPNLPASDQTRPPVSLDFSRNVVLSGPGFRSRGVLYFHQYQLDPPLTAGEAEALLPRLIRLDERQNVYSSGTHLLRLAADWQAIEGTCAHDVADWNRFWQQTDTGSLEGDVRFQGGDLHQRVLTAPEGLTADDFRLRPDSAGYRAGPDGKDFGADVDLVGPGQAYEQWKKTPEYQEWLIETNQVTNSASATPEPDAAARELAKWQGEWENADYGRLVIRGERWSSFPKDGFEVVSNIKIVEVTDEMTHILLLNAGVDGKVRTIQTTLRVDGDTLHNCGTIGSVRPTEFANKPGFIYTQWKRVSGPPP